MGIKRKSERQENTTILLTAPVFSRCWVKEQEVTREKKKEVAQITGKRERLFLGCGWGTKHRLDGSTVIFKAFLPQSFLTPLLPCFLTWERVYTGWGQAWSYCSIKVLFVYLRTTSSFYMLYSVATIYPLSLHLNNHFWHYYISKRESLPIFCEWHDGDGLSIGRFIKACNSHATSLSLLHGSNLSPSGQSTRRVAPHFHFTDVWSIKARHGAVGQCSHLKQDHCCDFPERGLALMGFCNFCAPQIPSMSCFLL